MAIMGIQLFSLPVDGILLFLFLLDALTCHLYLAGFISFLQGQFL